MSNKISSTRRLLHIWKSFTFLFFPQSSRAIKSGVLFFTIAFSPSSFCKIHCKPHKRCLSLCKWRNREMRHRLSRLYKQSHVPRASLVFRWSFRVVFLVDHSREAFLTKPRRPRMSYERRLLISFPDLLWTNYSKFSSRLFLSFLIGFSFSPTAEISRLELEFEESLPRKTASKRGLDRSQMEQPIEKNKFSYFARSRLQLRPQEIWERD